MKSILIMLMIASTSFSQTGYAADLETSSARRIARLKKHILSVATRAAAKQKYANEADPKVRRQLNGLVSQLLAIAPKQTIQEKLVESVGSWKDIWSDLPFTRALRTDVYQVVFPTGYYYNISKYEDGRGGFYTSYLRGQYEVRSEDFAIVFTKAVKEDRFPAVGTDIYRMAMKAELGLYDNNVDPENSFGLGRPGNLTTAYVDEDLRIVGGASLDTGVIDLLAIEIRQNVLK